MQEELIFCWYLEHVLSVNLLACIAPVLLHYLQVRAVTCDPVPIGARVVPLQLELERPDCLVAL